jgi:hypothetical protein
MKPRRALYIILAIPGTEMETKLKIVRNDISLILPQIH